MAISGLYREADDTAIGAFFRRKRAQIGAAKAITAAASKLARAYYHTMLTGKPWEEPGARAYHELQKDPWYVIFAPAKGVPETVYNQRVQAPDFVGANHFLSGFPPLRLLAGSSPYGGLSSRTPFVGSPFQKSQTRGVLRAENNHYQPEL